MGVPAASRRKTVLLFYRPHLPLSTSITPGPAVIHRGNVTVSASVATAAFRMMSLIPNLSVIRVTGRNVGVRLTGASHSLLFPQEEFVSSHRTDLG